MDFKYQSEIFARKWQKKHYSWNVKWRTQEERASFFLLVPRLSIAVVPPLFLSVCLVLSSGQYRRLPVL